MNFYDSFKFLGPFILSMKFEEAPDVKERIGRIVSILDMEHIKLDQIVCMRSFNSTSDANARIWSLPKIWQKALGVKAHYILEVLAQRYDKMSEDDKDRTMIHELMHIPKTFSGALLNHKAKVFDGKGGHKTVRINDRTVEK